MANEVISGPLEGACVSVCRCVSVCLCVLVCVLSSSSSSSSSFCLLLHRHLLLLFLLFHFWLHSLRRANWLMANFAQHGNVAAINSRSRAAQKINKSTSHVFFFIPSLYFSLSLFFSFWNNCVFIMGANKISNGSLSTAKKDMKYSNQIRSR